MPEISVSMQNILKRPREQKRVTISFLIVNYNGGGMLADCIASIHRQTFRDYEVIVVDNGSSDNSWNLPCFDNDQWRLLRLGHNSGFSYANNLALAESKGEFIALINNDVLLSPEWAANILRAMQANTMTGSAACLLLQMRHPGIIDSAGCCYHSCGTVTSWSGYQLAGFDFSNHKPFGAVASAALYRRTALEKVGLFHERYFAYYEDTDLAVRLVLHGYGCVFAHDATGLHYGSATGLSRSRFHIYHLRRNVEFLYWVDMIGTMALRHLVPHLLYELMAFIGAIINGKCLAFISAKINFLQSLRWVVGERRKLRLSLVAAGGITPAQHRLHAQMAPWTTVFWRRISGGNKAIHHINIIK